LDQGYQHGQCELRSGIAGPFAPDLDGMVKPDAAGSSHLHPQRSVSGGCKDGKAELRNIRVTRDLGTRLQVDAGVDALLRRPAESRKTVLRLGSLELDIGELRQYHSMRTPVGGRSRQEMARAMKLRTTGDVSPRRKARASPVVGGWPAICR
jgi:hypothetical protein